MRTPHDRRAAGEGVRAAAGDDPGPALVCVTFWGVRGRAVPLAVARMGLDRLHLRRTPGLRFAKLLGTGDGRSFTVRDADPRHWGLLTTWDDPADADRFAASTTHRRWASFADEQLDVRMVTASTRGRWSRREPFGRPAPRRVSGPVASITRARLRPGGMRSFWQAVPAVSADLHQVEGMRLAVGIGEAPIGLQGTFTLWDSEAAMAEFALRRSPHADVVRRAVQRRWFAEELFARFEVLSVAGTFAGVSPLEHTAGRA